MSRVMFILPPDRNVPCGGYKIVYEYANRLSARGWKVSIGYDCRKVGSKWPVFAPIRYLFSRWVSKFRSIFYPQWFHLSNHVGKICVFNESDIPQTDILVATAVGTVSLVEKKKDCKKVYLIQGYEKWNGRTEGEIKASFRLGMKNVVVAKWLKKIVDDACGEDNSIVLLNGINMEEFSLDKPIENRKVKQISMLYHKSEYKGSKYGVEVIMRLKKIYPDLQVVMFGAPKRPSDLPLWIDYVQNATSIQLRKIYNDSQIFLYPTIEEGFGLTCVESMACGCALCSTNYLGAQEFASDGENALLSPVKDVDAMINNTRRLLDDDELRISLAKKGKKSVEKFDWNKSVKELEKIMSTPQ